MSTFQVSPGGLAQASAAVGPAVSALTGYHLPEPDPAMYGPLVGSAASDCEPATTQSFNELVAALGNLYGTIETRLDESSRCYQATEDGQVELARAILELLGVVH